MLGDKFKYITNPKTGRKVLTRGKTGKKILNNYINQLGGANYCDFRESSGRCFKSNRWDPQDRCMYNYRSGRCKKNPRPNPTKNTRKSKKKLKVVARKTKSNPRQKELMTLSKDLRKLVENNELTLDQAISMNTSHYEPRRSAAKVARKELRKSPRKEPRKSPRKEPKKSPKKTKQEKIKLSADLQSLVDNGELKRKQAEKIFFDGLNIHSPVNIFKPLSQYTGQGPYIEHQYSHFCAKHAINHLLQEEKVVRGNLSRLWIGNNTSNPLTNPNAKLSLHYCASEVAREEARTIGIHDVINKPYLEDNDFLDFKDGNWTVKTILYALNNVFNFKTDLYYNHGDKIWTGEGRTKRSEGNPPSTLIEDVANPDLIGFIVNIEWTDSYETLHKHFIALHNRWNGCHPGNGFPNQFTYLESIVPYGKEEPVWGCGSFENIMNWISTTYTIHAIIAVFKNRDSNGNIISYNCPGCN